jgi:hypothetical protein
MKIWATSRVIIVWRIEYFKRLPTDDSTICAVERRDRQAEKYTNMASVAYSGSHRKRNKTVYEQCLEHTELHTYFSLHAHTE